MNYSKYMATSREAQFAPSWRVRAIALALLCVTPLTALAEATIQAITASPQGGNDVVRIDYSLPGCPPPADALWQFLTDFIAGRTPSLGHGLIHYD